VCIYPNYYGSGAVFSLDGSEYDLMITRDDVFIGLNQAGRKFKKGETLTARFLVIHEFGIDRDDAGMRDFASSYGIGASPAYRIAASTEVNQDFYPTILTQDYGAEVRIGKTDLANDLFLKVVGLNPNWSAGCYDSDEKSLVVQGVLEGAAYVPVDTRRARNLYVGNVLVCDWPDVRLTLLKSGPSGIEFQAHNPTNTAVTTVIKSPGAKAGLVELKHELSLKPGEIRVVTVKDN
jgi:hypothetical protein